MARQGAPTCPQAAANLLREARGIKAFANEHRIKPSPWRRASSWWSPSTCPAAAMTPPAPRGRPLPDGQAQADAAAALLLAGGGTRQPASGYRALPGELFGETDAEEGAPFAEMEGGASGSASDPASSVPRGIATDPAAGVSKNARTGSAKAVSQNAPTDSRRGGRACPGPGPWPRAQRQPLPLPLAPRGAANGAPTTSPRAMPPASVWPPSAPPVPPSAKRGDSRAARAAKCRGRQ